MYSFLTMCVCLCVSAYSAGCFALALEVILALGSAAQQSGRGGGEVVVVCVCCGERGVSWGIVGTADCVFASAQLGPYACAPSARAHAHRTWNSCAPSASRDAEFFPAFPLRCPSRQPSFASLTFQFYPPALPPESRPFHSLALPRHPTPAPTPLSLSWLPSYFRPVLKSNPTAVNHRILLPRLQ